MVCGIRKFPEKLPYFIFVENVDLIWFTLAVLQEPWQVITKGTGRLTRLEKATVSNIWNSREKERGRSDLQTEGKSIAFCHQLVLGFHGPGHLSQSPWLVLCQLPSPGHIFPSFAQKGDVGGLLCRCFFLLWLPQGWIFGEILGAEFLWKFLSFMHDSKGQGLSPSKHFKMQTTLSFISRGPKPLTGGSHDQVWLLSAGPRQGDRWAGLCWNILYLPLPLKT